jgi:hypothetical protein
MQEWGERLYIQMLPFHDMKNHPFKRLIRRAATKLGTQMGSGEELAASIILVERYV